MIFTSLQKLPPEEGLQSQLLETRIIVRLPVRKNNDDTGNDVVNNSNNNININKHVVLIVVRHKRKNQNQNQMKKIMFVSDKKKRGQNKSILPYWDNTSSTAASTVASYISKIIQHKQQQQQQKQQKQQRRSRSQQPSNSRRKKRLRSVRFPRSGTGLRILCLRDYNPHEI